MATRSAIALALLLLVSTGGSCARRNEPPRQRLADPAARAVPEDTVRATPAATPAEPRAATPAALAQTDTLPGYDADLPVEDMPRLFKRTEPVYPEAARRARIQGVVLTRVLVMPDGSVGAVRVVQSIPALDQAAMDCVRQWRFQRAKAEDAPLPAWVGVPIHFTLP